MRFKFRFNALLQQRRYALEKAQQALAGARQEYEHLLGRRELQRSQVVEQYRLLDEQGGKGIDVSRYITGKDYILFLEQQLLTLDKEIEHSKRNVEEKKGLLQEREKELKMLEILEEKDRAKHRSLQNKNEQKQTDAVAVFQDYAHKRETGDG